MVSNTSGSTMRISLDPWGVLAPEQMSAAAEAAAGAKLKIKGPSVMLEFVYLMSWDRMGQAEVSCQGKGRASHPMIQQADSLR